MLVLLDLPMHWSVFVAYAIPSLIGLKVLTKAGVLSARELSLSVTRQSKYFAMNNLSAVCYNWLVNVYVSVLLGQEEVVLYTLVTRVAAMLSLPATASTPMIQARVAEKHGSGESRSVAKFSGMIVVLTTLLQLLCVISLVLIACFTDYLNDVTQSGLAIGFLFYCLTQIFHVLSGPAGLILLMTGESRKVSRLTLLLGFASLFAGSTCTWLYGVAGTLFVNGLISVIQNVCFNVMLYRRDGYLPIQAAFASIGKERSVG